MISCSTPHINAALNVVQDSACQSSIRGTYAILGTGSKTTQGPAVQDMHELWV
jgi:hypothetical protein